MTKTFKEIADAWKDTRRPFVRESTLSVYEQALKTHLIPAFGNETELRESGILSFIRQKQEAGLSATYIKSLLKVLRMIVRFAEKKGWYPHLEWYFQIPAEKKLIEVFPLAAHKTLLRYVQTNFTLRNSGIYLSLATGMRIGEVCGLKWADIDVVNGIVNVERTVERIVKAGEGNGATKLVIAPPKTPSSRRIIPIPTELKTLLSPFKKLYSPDVFLLTGTTTPEEPAHYRLYYKKVLNRLGLPLLKFHALRHSFATRCVESGCDCKTLSAILGHSSVSITLNLYVHPDFKQKQKCIAKVFKALS